MTRIRILTPAAHGVLDYAAALTLALLPLLLGFSGPALWVSAAGAAGLLAYSLLTDYRFGAARLMSFRAHLAADLTAAVAFAAAPFLLGWSGQVAAYYWIMAAGVTAVVALTRTEERGDLRQADPTCCSGARPTLPR
ncbi:MAG: hypothetical protein L6Q83_02450 [Gammaproteobacteria bacterium]|nr:hypothetical protein [Gammaproteobacteria bacterium]